MLIIGVSDHFDPSKKLSDDLNIAAQKYAEKLAKLGKMKHADKSERPGCGENLAWSMGMNHDLGTFY